MFKIVDTPTSAAADLLIEQQLLLQEMKSLNSFINRLFVLYGIAKPVTYKQCRSYFESTAARIAPIGRNIVKLVWGNGIGTDLQTIPARLQAVSFSNRMPLNFGLMKRIVFTLISGRRKGIRLRFSGYLEAEGFLDPAVY